MGVRVYREKLNMFQQETKTAHRQKLLRGERLRKAVISGLKEVPEVFQERVEVLSREEEALLQTNRVNSHRKQEKRMKIAVKAVKGGKAIKLLNSKTGFQQAAWARGEREEAYKKKE